MKAVPAFTDLLTKLDTELVSTIKEDITKHLARLSKKRIAFYGYAIQTPSYTDVEQPIVIYNREEDLADANRESTYYRYSVDEWQNFEDNALPKTTKLMSVIDKRLKKLDEDPIAYDAMTAKYYKTVYKLFGQALSELKAEEAFPKGTFLVVWNREPGTVISSARKLNPRSVAKAVSDEFGE